MKTFVFLATLLTATTVSAEPRFEVLDRGTAIEVIAHDVKAATTAVTPIRSRLEINVVGTPRAPALIPTMTGIKVIQLDGQSPQRVLSVKLPFERLAVKTMARYAQAIQVGDDLHLMFPRDVPAEGARVVLPEPTLPPALADKIAKPLVTPFGPELKAAPITTAAAATKPAIAEPKLDKALPTTTEPSKPFLAEDQPGSNLSTLLMLALGGVGCVTWLIRRKKKTTTPTTHIEVIAQRSLGAKAKVVWLNAGGREMVIAVTPQQVRMLGQWKKTERTDHERPAVLPEATALETPRERPQLRAVTSPVAGILKLRQRAPSVEALHDDIATGDLDADALWAKEIFAASAGGRR